MPDCVKKGKQDALDDRRGHDRVIYQAGGIAYLGGEKADKPGAAQSEASAHVQLGMESNVTPDGCIQQCRHHTFQRHCADLDGEQVVVAARVQQLVSAERAVHAGAYGPGVDELATVRRAVRRRSDQWP
ncbi:hypothetical protein Ari01nite_87950 [Paractinoplanes rishiriensis]|uniref:Uncharacterized protein n=1 Tax=Paractinoplanes rishiriensis TaxID=1050105 RepID=A0A919N1F6_9ACTN|nr:hypothetical protein Ari01nite_87950 [Actinoplanes rishiriensis]